MGIDGLLNLLRPLTQKQHISSFTEKTIAIDAMPWIYKGCYSCAMSLNQDIESNDFLYYILEMLDMMSYYKIKPIFVFDGRAVGAKSETLDKRKKLKQQNKAKGLEFLKNNQMQQAKKYLSRCIIIDERILAATINTLNTKNIQFIVSPYQADCQISKLKRLGLIDAAISEDSDLITYGVNVIYKLNQNGQCDYIDLDRWRPKDFADIYLKYFLAFDQMNRIDAAVLAGSDYNASVKGIGIKRAIKLLVRQATMKNVINMLKNKKNYMSKIPEDYEFTVEKSKLIFCLSTVYNPFTKSLECLRPQLVDQLKPQKMSMDELLEIVGPHYEYNQEMSKGRINCKTLQRRQVLILSFPQIFRISKQNMMAHQALNKRRRAQQKQAKERAALQRLERNQPEQQDMNILQHVEEARRRAKSQLQETEQDKAKRLEERKNRINKLHELMNTLVDPFGDSESQSENQDGEEMPKSSIETSESLKNSLGVKNSQNQHPTAEKPNLQQKQQDFQQESISQNLDFLNPFAKKGPTAVVLKPEHLTSTKKNERK